MNKNGMMKRMTEICFKVHGVSLQLEAGHLLRAASATTLEERGKHLEAAAYVSAPVKALVKTQQIIGALGPERPKSEELPEPFNELEHMTEEELGEWIVAEVKDGKERAEEK